LPAREEEPRYLRRGKGSARNVVKARGVAGGVPGCALGQLLRARWPLGQTGGWGSLHRRGQCRACGPHSAGAGQQQGRAEVRQDPVHFTHCASSALGDGCTVDVGLGLVPHLGGDMASHGPPHQVTVAKMDASIAASRAATPPRVEYCSSARRLTRPPVDVLQSTRPVFAGRFGVGLICLSFPYTPPSSSLLLQQPPGASVWRSRRTSLLATWRPPARGPCLTSRSIWPRLRRLLLAHSAGSSSLGPAIRQRQSSVPKVTGCTVSVAPAHPSQRHHAARPSRTVTMLRGMIPQIA
jgi:hypothetical protein